MSVKGTYYYKNMTFITSSWHHITSYSGYYLSLLRQPFSLPDLLTFTLMMPQRDLQATQTSLHLIYMLMMHNWDRSRTGLTTAHGNMVNDWCCVWSLKADVRTLQVSGRHCNASTLYYDENSPFILRIGIKNHLITTIKTQPSCGVLNGHTLCISECAEPCVLSSDDNINHIGLGHWNIHVNPSPISCPTQNPALLLFSLQTYTHTYRMYSSNSCHYSKMSSCTACLVSPVPRKVEGTQTPDRYGLK